MPGLSFDLSLWPRCCRWTWHPMVSLPYSPLDWRLGPPLSFEGFLPAIHSIDRDLWSDCSLNTCLFGLQAGNSTVTRSR